MRILIIRFSAIGDIISTTSLPRVIKNKYPEARVDFLTSIEFKCLLDENSNIDNLFVINRAYTGIRQIKSMAVEIEKRNYNIIIDAHNTLRTNILSLFIKTTPIVKFSKNRIRKFILENFKFNLLKNLPLNLVRHANALKKFGLSYDGKGTELFVPKNIQTQVKEKIKKIKRPYIVFVPGAAWKNKKWDAKNYISLIKKITKKGYAAIILGLEKDKILETDENNYIHNFCGKLSLIESIAILENSEVVVGNDTGLIHAAEALKKDVLVILGPTSRAYGMTPFREKSQVVETTLFCRPCSSYGSKPCIRFSRACLTKISANMVYDKLDKYLNISKREQ